MAIPDQAYTTLLNHLHRPESTLSLPTVQASISHYLAQPAPHPTQFTATVISSPFFRVLSHPKLQTLSTAFRQATHLKYAAFRDDQYRIFSRSLKTRLELWASDILAGIRGGQAIVRLACCGGVLLGIDDLKARLHLGEQTVKGHLEDEVVLALAEVMDTFGNQQSAGAWENEFKPVAPNGEDPLALALMLASQSLMVVSSEKLAILPLQVFQVFVRLLMSTIDSAFHHGTFLSLLTASVTTSETHSIQISSTSPFAREIQSISSSSLMSNIGPLSKLCARSLALLLELQPDLGIITLAETLHSLKSLDEKVASDWESSPLSSVTDENAIAPDTRELSKTIWTILKTLLFSTIMIIEASLSALAFIPLHNAEKSLLVTDPHRTSASSIAQSTINILFNLSFVISQFGGVTAASNDGFPQLKRVFYLALDILAEDEVDAENFVRELCSIFGDGRTLPSGRPIQAKMAFALACIEQLTPVISRECIEFHVLPLSLQHLSDASHRETFESSHSVVLAILAHYAQCISDASAHHTTPDPSSVEFVQKLVAFYTTSLIENSADDRLGTPQLKLAFSALVRSASAGINFSDTRSCTDDCFTLVWLCIRSLLDAIQTLPRNKECESQLHRLCLTLVSTVSFIPLPLLPSVLDEILNIIVDTVEGRRKELTELLFEEISERTGNAEKEFVLRWWYDNREKLLLGEQRPISSGL